MPQPVCIIKDCNKIGKTTAKIDIGPTIGDSVVSPEARLHTIRLCEEHHFLLSGKIEPGAYSIDWAPHE